MSKRRAMKASPTGPPRRRSGKRSRRAALALALMVAVLGAGVALRTGAQTGPGRASATRTPVEEEAYRLYTENHLISARTKAEQALGENPDSLVGHLVLGAVLHEAEGSLARAMFHLGRARELYESTWSASLRPAGAPWELHRQTLFLIQGLAGEMELHEYRLQILGYHDYLYDPDLLSEHAWPLMALGRFDEARDFARRAINSRADAWQRSSGLNVLCAVEGEAETREPYWEACSAALDNARRRRDDGEQDVALAVHAYNAAQAARATLRFDEAEALCLEAARRLELTPANPWRLLVRQYLDEGRMTDAVEALGQMQRWRARQPAYLRDQDRAETDVTFATLLLVAGDAKTGLRAVDRALEQPDRRGLTSSTGEQALGAHALLRRALARMAAEQALEEASATSAFGALGGSLDAAGRRLGAWPDDERIAGVLSDEGVLTATFRPYLRGGIQPVPPWLLGDLIDVLGAGVVGVALHRARALEGPASPVVPYLDALEAEVALARSEAGRAFNMAKSALDRLPSREVLLRARVAAVGAEAAERGGYHRDSLALFEEALAADGGVLRRLGLEIPATVRARGGGAVGKEAADLIEGSPRLRSGSGFEVVVDSPDGHAVSACLLSPSGSRLGCAQVDPGQLARDHAREEQEYRDALAARRRARDRPARGDEQGGHPGGDPPGDEDLQEPEEPEPAVELAKAFQRDVFSAHVTLSSTDMSSLDGRTTTGEEVAREHMRELLQQAIGTEP